jgi:nucleoside-triphosphatase
MKEKTIYYLTGPVHMGKTTRLNEWIKYQKNVDGILAPIIDGQRHLHRIKTGELQQLELNDENSAQKIVKIGQYQFTGEVFDWARQQLYEAAQSCPDWLIIDEIGPLELGGEGLEPAVSIIISSLKTDNHTKLLLVIRDRLLTEVLQHYKINNHEPFRFST